jgi:hypothetical protein
MVILQLNGIREDPYDGQDGFIYMMYLIQMQCV